MEDKSIVGLMSMGIVGYLHITRRLGGIYITEAYETSLFICHDWISREGYIARVRTYSVCSVISVYPVDFQKKRIKVAEAPYCMFRLTYLSACD